MKFKKIANKKFLIITIIIFVLIVLTCLLLFRPSLKYDSDSEFRTASQGHMTLCNNQMFAVSSYNYKTDTDFGRNEFSVGNILSVKYKDYELYLNNNFLYCKKDNQEIKISDNPVNDFKVYRNCVFYSCLNDKNLYMYNMENQKHSILPGEFDYLNWFEIKNERIYTSYFKRIENEYGFFNCVNVRIYRYSDLSILKSTVFNVPHHTAFFAIDENNVFYNCYLGNENILGKLDFNRKDGEMLYDINNERELKRYCIKYISCNDESIFFLVEHSKLQFYYEETLDYPDNGIWEYNINSKESKRISEKCQYTDMLATDNYLYLYSTNYIFPRRMLDEINFGYTIEQMDLKDK